MNIFYQKSITVFLTLVCLLTVLATPALAATVNVTKTISTMTLTGFSVPDQVTYGQSYTLKGTINSNLNVSSVTIQIFNASNAAEISKTMTNSGKIFAISKIDPYIKFGKLSPGKKTIVVSAIDGAGSKTLYNKSFTVVKPVVKITFQSSANSSVVSSYTLGVIKQMLTNAGLSSAIITSTIRTPKAQAEAMYANCEKTGPAQQKSIYAAAGDKIIDVYIAGKKAGKTKSQIVSDMMSKINSIWPERVSLHCVPENQYKKLNVLDISQSSISNRSVFEKQLAAAKNNGTVQKYLIENGCYHLEIPVK